MSKDNKPKQYQVVLSENEIRAILDHIKASEHYDCTLIRQKLHRALDSSTYDQY